MFFSPFRKAVDMFNNTLFIVATDNRYTPLQGTEKREGEKKYNLTSIQTTVSIFTMMLPCRINRSVTMMVHKREREIE